MCGIFACLQRQTGRGSVKGACLKVRNLVHPTSHIIHLIVYRKLFRIDFTDEALTAYMRYIFRLLKVTYSYTCWELYSAWEETLPHCPWVTNVEIGYCGMETHLGEAFRLLPRATVLSIWRNRCIHTLIKYFNSDWSWGEWYSKGSWETVLSTHTCGDSQCTQYCTWSLVFCVLAGNITVTVYTWLTVTLSTVVLHAYIKSILSILCAGIHSKPVVW